MHACIVLSVQSELHNYNVTYCGSLIASKKLVEVLVFERICSIL